MVELAVYLGKTALYFLISIGRTLNGDADPIEVAYVVAVLSLIGLGTIPYMRKR